MYRRFVRLVLCHAGVPGGCGLARRAGLHSKGSKGSASPAGSSSDPPGGHHLGTERDRRHDEPTGRHPPEVSRPENQAAGDSGWLSGRPGPAGSPGAELAAARRDGRRRPRRRVHLLLDRLQRRLRRRAAQPDLEGERSVFADYFQRLTSLDREQRIYEAIWQRFSQEIRLLLRNKFVFQPFWRTRTASRDTRPGRRASSAAGAGSPWP